jgi:molybdopterin-containing oxidoreductase family membrane subunit
MRHLGRAPNPKWYVPFVFISIIWAISIHTVTAFLYCGLGGRPFWNTALLAPRFLASAFVSGPAFIILALQVVRRRSRFHVGEGPVRTLVNIMRITMLINLLMLGSELFTEFYTGGSHTSSAHYLFFGLHGHSGLTPWIWTSIAFSVLATVLLLRPRVHERPWQLDAACALAFAGIWIEKGMGLIIPGFIPSTLHEIVEYAPSLVEWKITAGIWAFGLMVYTLALKIATNIFTARVMKERALAAESNARVAETRWEPEPLEPVAR